MTEPFLLSRVLLQFEQGTKTLLSNLSAVTLTPDGNLWVGSDELNKIGSEEVNTIERLSPLDSDQFGKHQTFALRDFIDLPDHLGETDIEGLDNADSYLWLVGSHSTKRKKPKGNNLKKDIQRLAEVKVDPNRFLIARIPVVAGELHKSCPDPDNSKRQLTAACLKRKKQGNQLIKALREDEHLGTYVSSILPSKENGFDIEGIAAYKNRLFLGLRGPVLGDWAILLEVEVTESDGELKLKRIGEAGQRYRKHFLQLDGLGVRDLQFQGSDLLILAGPTMDLVGRLRVYRWRDALHTSKNTICEQGATKLEVVLELPYSSTGDKAEGIALFPSVTDANALLVVYDSPNSSRLVGDDGILADIFRLSETNSEAASS